MITNTTKCPFCAGEIEVGVRKCKHCAEWLDPSDRKRSNQPIQTDVGQAINDYNKGHTIGVIIVLIIVFVVILIGLSWRR